MSVAGVLSGCLRPTFSVWRANIGRERLASCVASMTRLPEVTQPPLLLLKHATLSQQPNLLTQIRGLRSGPMGWGGGRAGVRTAAVTQEVVEDSEEAEKQLSKEVIHCVNQQVQTGEYGRLFAVVFLQGKQHLVTTGDLVVNQGFFPPNIGDELRLEKVLMVGSRDFSLYGRPLLRPGLVHVEARVVEKTLSHCRIYFRYQRRKNSRKSKFNRETHTVLRITRVEVMRPVGEVPEVEGIEGKIF
ncbi:hypothetical protein Pcinc_040805 [Petrolisthes cinctipes]|uniref:Large ribosomal subunit protein bL21m n=1 Tax=Petrolisthes cinctipes TaxID=88211 RepID=A0AAE1BL61_PETCI|nr:hypothetical protein Pcinc_040805 [Petrolisthes cinctipes]